MLLPGVRLPGPRPFAVVAEPPASSVRIPSTRNALPLVPRGAGGGPGAMLLSLLDQQQHPLSIARPIPRPAPSEAILVPPVRGPGAQPADPASLEWHVAAHADTAIGIARMMQSVDKMLYASIWVYDPAQVRHGARPESAEGCHPPLCGPTDPTNHAAQGGECLTPCMVFDTQLQYPESQIANSDNLGLVEFRVQRSQVRQFTGMVYSKPGPAPALRAPPPRAVC